MPVPPKDPALRQRRNKATTRAELPAEGSRKGKPAPPLPRRGADDPEWHKSTRRWWRVIWASPMASRWLKADIEALYFVAELVDAFNYRPTASLAAEIRHQQAGFGLTPIDRRRLEWTISDTEEKAAAGEESPARKRRRAEDPRAILRIVEK